MSGFTIVRARHSRHQNIHADAARSGLRSLGIEAADNIGGVGVKTKNIVGWGWRLNKQLFEKGHNALVMERGYIGDRFSLTSMGWNGLNGHAIFPKYPDDGGERFRKHGGFIRPWKKEGKYILILGQVKGDASLQGRDLSKWYADIARIAGKAHKMPVYFRPHPESRRRGGFVSVGGVPTMGGSLDEALESAYFTICFNSNSAVDSIMKGVPCFAGDKGTMAYELCMKDLNAVEYPERDNVLHSIAWTQWNIDEISSGLPFKKLLEITPC